MSHSDDKGLVCPPRLAPTQAVIVPIWKSEDEREKVLEVGERMRQELRAGGVRVELDVRDGVKPGAKYYEWEGRGVPVRLEVGPRDVAQQQAMLARRIGGKEPVKLAGLAATVSTALDEIQSSLFNAAVANREANTVRNVSRDQLIEIMDGRGGFAYGGFCGSEQCELEIKDRTKATIRVLPDAEFRSETVPTACVWCGSPAMSEAVWAKAY